MKHEMRLFDLYFNFDGRIGRGAWWLGALGLLFASVGGTLAISPHVFDFHGLAPRLPNWPDTIWQLALVIPATALMVKRFNDRDRPFWTGYAYGMLAALLTVAPHFGIFVAERMDHRSTALLALFVLAYFFALIDNGFLRGTAGPNQYGPDPQAARTLTP
jgi:uncharacterized membrane protein YhaH (DUF805 family)